MVAGKKCVCNRYDNLHTLRMSHCRDFSSAAHCLTLLCTSFEGSSRAITVMFIKAFFVGTSIGLKWNPADPTLNPCGRSPCNARTHHRRQVSAIVAKMAAHKGKVTVCTSIFTMLSCTLVWQNTPKTLSLLCRF
jgi:hypothetical protein